MIPKIIHYCWFGGQKMPADYQKYIKEWSEANPSYKIMRWDESNSPMKLAYLKKAKANKKWANMSNLVRFYALQDYGGIYLDTDMKVIKPLDSLLQNKCFLGFEEGKEDSDVFWVNNAVIGAMPNHPFIKLCYKEILKRFDGTEEANLSAPRIVTDLLKEKRGLKKYGSQLLKDVRLYPVDVFYPIHYKEVYKTNELNKYITNSTIAVHMWGRTWYTQEALLHIVDDLQKWTQEREEAIKWLNGQLANYTTENKNLNERLVKSDESINRLKEEVVLSNNSVRLNEEVNKLFVQNNELIKSFETLNQKVQENNDLLEVRMTQLMDSEEKVLDLVKAINSESKLSAELSRKIEVSEKEFELKGTELAKKFQDLGDKERKVSADLIDEKHTVEILELKIKRLNSEINVSKNVLNEKISELQSKDEIIIKLEKSLSEIKEINNNVAKNNVELQYTIELKESTLTESKNQLISLKNAISEMKIDFSVKLASLNDTLLIKDNDLTREKLLNASLKVELDLINKEKAVHIKELTSVIKSMRENEKKYSYDIGRKDDMMEQLKKSISEQSLQIDELISKYKLANDQCLTQTDEISKLKDQIKWYVSTYEKRSLPGVIKEKLLKKRK
ncbi:MAG TPA: glycosyltransferase [Bacteroidia bacterium]|jgi:chromosome segregation ATPase|nr:glycosyltransferase [Bacteroidia bacterium]